MIEELHIRGLGVIEDSSLLLGPGLTVVTGETGAGKTLLVTALQLLLGARASADLVRRGADLATIEAVVRLPQGAPAAVEDHADDEQSDVEATLADLRALAEDGRLIVSREIPTSGRSRARVGGRLVPTSILTALLAPSIEIHGQHEHVRLERPAVQLRLLDAFGSEDHRAAADAYRTAFATWSEAERRRRMLREDEQARTVRLERLRAERDEIDAARLDPETDGTLDQDIDRLANAEALQDAIGAARRSAGPEGALQGVGEALAALRRSPVEDRQLAEIAVRLTALSRDLSDAVADLATLAVDIEADDARLDALQERKRVVTTLRRRYGADVVEILEHRQAVAAEIADLEAVEGDAAGIEDAVARAAAALEDAGAALTRARRVTGERLSEAVGAHLHELGMPHASLTVELTAAPPGPAGNDRASFLLAANPGEPPARLSDAASGGERSRVALAIEVALSGADARSVLVFDEVDAGVGGSTALAVGDKLARLARDADVERQVLCVTHLAQVAASADAHHVVEKAVVDGRTVTTVRQVAAEERAAELSRMLGGEATAEAGLEHARRLLAAAGGWRAD